MVKRTYGTVHRNSIQIEEALGPDEGERVEVTVERLGGSAGSIWGEGLRRCAGALAGLSGLEEDMQLILSGRKEADFRDPAE